MAAGHGGIHHLRPVNDLPEALCGGLHQLLAGEVALFLHLQLTGQPQPLPCDLISGLCCRHGLVHQILDLAALALDLVSDGTAHIRVEEAHFLPQGDAAVLQHLLPLCLRNDLFGQGLRQILVVDHGAGPDVGGGLQHGHSQVRRHGGPLVFGDGLGGHAFASCAVLLYAVDVLQKRHHVVVGSAAPRTGHLPLHGSRPHLPVVLVLAAILIVVPLLGIQHRQGQRIVLGHVRHVVGEHVENTSHHDGVVGSLRQRLHGGNVQQPVKASLLAVRFGGPILRIGLNGEVVLLRELPVPESLHAGLVAPFRRLMGKEIPDPVGDLPLLSGQASDDVCRILFGEEGPDALPVPLVFSLNFRGRYAAAVQMPPSLLPLVQKVEAHDLRRCQKDALPAFQLERLRIRIAVPPFPDFLVLEKLTCVLHGFVPPPDHHVVPFPQIADQALHGRPEHFPEPGGIGHVILEEIGHPV